MTAEIIFAKKRNELKGLIKSGAIIVIETKKQPRIYPVIVLEPKQKKPKMTNIEKRRRLIEIDLEKIQKKADAFKIILAKSI
jgi:hypothetical protein